MEIWKKINTIKELRYISKNYEISNLGRLRNIETDKYLKFSTRCGHGKSPYLVISLKCQKIGKRKKLSIHRLVAMAFIPIENPNKMTVNHKDFNTLNNDLSNLEWMTIGDNIRYSQKNKTYVTDDVDSLIYEYNNSSLTLLEFSSKYNVPFNTMYDVLNNMGNKEKLIRRRFIISNELKSNIQNDIGILSSLEILKKYNISLSSFYNIKRSKSK